MKTKIPHFRLLMILLLCLPLGVTSCSGDQQQQEDEVQAGNQEDEDGDQQQEQDGDQQEDQGQDQDQDQEQQEVGQEEVDDEGGNEIVEDVGNEVEEVVEESAAANNAMASEFQNEAGVAAGEGINNSTESEFVEGEVAATPATDTGVEAVAEEAAAPEETPETEATYTPGGRVKYIMSGGATLFSSMEGGEPAGMLEQGDHPVVFEEGEWARTSDGLYLPVSSLSTEPIGRMEPEAMWQ